VSLLPVLHGRRAPAGGADGGTAEGLRWWREVAAALAFYAVYSVIRNTQGSAAVPEAEAFGNALRIIRLEELLGLYRERAVQAAFLGWHAFIGFWNFFYGSMHFVVTGTALVLLYRRFPSRYRRWRTVLAATTGLALVGYALFPLMPPRLLPASFGFVDTLRRYGSPWSFDSTAVSRLSNQYAAMPSLHFAWAVWSTVVLVHVVRHAWAKVLAAAYPALTLFSIVVTANHFVLDAAGGAAVLALGSFTASALTSVSRPQRPPAGAARHPLPAHP
jgi:hypothetical protein